MAFARELLVYAQELRNNSQIVTDPEKNRKSPERRLEENGQG